MQLVAQYVACLPFLSDNTHVGTPPGVQSAGVTGEIFADVRLSDNKFSHIFQLNFLCINAFIQSLHISKNYAYRCKTLLLEHFEREKLTFSGQDL